MDFSKIVGKPNLERLTSPRDIFTALPSKAAGFGYLRDTQGQVLEAWYQRRAERDIVIKMNTGSGKTIVGLLILQSSLNEGVSPALYVAPSQYLAEQVEAHANRLGIQTTGDPESTAYLSGRAIGVVNVSKLVNGKSIFGGPGSSRATPSPIGAVVIDDAHAALITVEAQSTVVLPSTHPAYRKLFDLFRGDLRQQSETKLMDIESADATAVLRVPFWAWSDHISDVHKILHESKDDDGLKFELPFIADVLKFSSAIFTSTSLEIRPSFPPTQTISSFANAARRIYLTATLPDDGVLVSHFDADPQSVLKPITPTTAADLGDRLILAPQEITPDIEDDEVRQAIRKLADKVNVVVLVPSRRRAERWVNVADATAAADSVAGVVARLQAGHVGLVVLIAKYDGIDLPDDACRVLVIDGLPEVYGAFDRRQALALGESEAMTGRQLQRIEQGMGRGVRSADDHCVVVLVGPRLAQLIADRRYLTKVSPATRAQMELSEQIAEELRGKPLSDQMAAAQQVLDRDKGWVTASKSSLAGVEYPPGQVDEAVRLSRAAFNAAAIGRFDQAVDQMTRAVNASVEPRLKGWRQEEVAVYKHQIDPAAAQQVLAGAKALNQAITRPLAGIGYRRLSAADNQARAAAAFLKDTYPDRNSLVVGINALLDDFVFDPDGTAEFEDATELLGLHLGFASQRPERDTGNGPDVLWALGAQRYAVIEAKSGSTSNVIHRKDVAQLAHSMNWFEQNYDGDSTAQAILVHPVNVLAPDAVAPAGCRVMTKEKVGALRDAIRAMAVALADGDKWGDPEAVGEQLRSRMLTAGEIMTFHATTTRADRAATAR